MAAARAREDPAPDAAPRRHPQAYRHRLRPGPQPPRRAQDQPKPLSAPQWIKLVKAAFKTHAGVPLAPKELRSSFITFLHSGHNSDAVGRLRHAALVDAGARAGLRQGARGAAERRGGAGGDRLSPRASSERRGDRRLVPPRPQDSWPGRRGHTRSRCTQHSVQGTAPVVEPDR